MTDEKLAALLNEDPDRGMSLVIERYTGLVLSIVGAKLRPPLFSEGDVEECAADVFADIWRNRAAFDPKKGSLKTWTARIAVNNANDRLRRRCREPRNVPLEEREDLPDERTIEETVGSREERAELIRAIGALGRRDRELITRRFFLGQSSAETARDMGMTAAAVDTGVHRAIKKLRKKMGERENG
ncbi:MAG: sigma-70 family RNA polymerase sigma factor [Clostridiales bacterium]|nr:sigma-70 family RNA polymerase sigma factor [Clostridiales bacterium]